MLGPARPTHVIVRERKAGLSAASRNIHPNWRRVPPNQTPLATRVFTCRQGCPKRFIASGSAATTAHIRGNRIKTATMDDANPVSGFAFNGVWIIPANPPHFTRQINNNQRRQHRLH